MLREVMSTRVPQVSRRFDEQLQRWMEVISFPAGDMLGIQVRDVTEREQARRRMLDDSRLLHARSMLMDSARDAMIMRGLDDVIEYANAQARALFDGSGELVGRSLHDVLGLGQEQAREIENAIGSDGMWEGDVVVSLPEGPRITETLWIAVDGPDGHPDAVFCTLTDVTDRRRQDEALLRTQRMESIGTLASGIAHDLNNVLTPLLLATQLLASSETDPARLRVLEGMRQTVDRGSDMIRQVLTFARGVEGERVVVDVAELARRFAAFCRDTLPKDIEIETVVQEGLAVVGDPTQLLQVLMNFATNARDAMPAGGRLRLRASGDDQQVAIEVADDGAGMPPDVLGRIFEPFFTTKGLGRGTGLGLPVSQAIARTHGGSLEATSHPGQGTVFRLELPRATSFDGDESAPDPRPHTDLDGLRVLVVDDHDDIVATALLVIDGAGGAPLGAESADAARELLASQPVDVVVTDLVMPGMTGRRFLDLLATDHPQLPVVTMSGVPEQGADAAQRTNVKAVLDKPFSAERLLDALQTAVGRA
jgi:two-component system, cell cycle sensor histidine kinase and response regulator CckA